MLYQVDIPTNTRTYCYFIEAPSISIAHSTMSKIILGKKRKIHPAIEGHVVDNVLNTIKYNDVELIKKERDFWYIIGE